MHITLKVKTKKNSPNFLKSDLNEYLVDKDKITEYLKPLWFKGSRYR